MEKKKMPRSSEKPASPPGERQELPREEEAGQCLL